MKINQELLGKLEGMDIHTLIKIQNYYQNNPQILKSCQDIAQYIKGKIELLQNKEKSRI